MQFTVVYAVFEQVCSSTRPLGQMGRSRYLLSASILSTPELTINQVIPVELSLTTNLSTKSGIDQRAKTKSIGRCISIIPSRNRPVRGFVLRSILLVLMT